MATTTEDQSRGASCFKKGCFCGCVGHFLLTKVGQPVQGEGGKGDAGPPSQIIGLTKQVSCFANTQSRFASNVPEGFLAGSSKPSTEHL